MATLGEVGYIKEGNAKDRTKLVEWSNGGSIATFGKVGNTKEGNAKDRTKATFGMFLSIADSCGRGISVVCQIWLLVVVLVVFANFQVVLGKVILLS